MKERKYFNVGNMRYRVKNFNPEKKLKQGYAYVKDNLVLPFRGKIKKSELGKIKLEIGIYKVVDKETKEEFYKVVKPLYRKEYDIKNIYVIDKDYISDIIEEEGIHVDKDIILMDSGDIFAPPILETDNILQRIIKTALKEKKIDLKAYANRFESATDMNNFRRAIMKHGMSVDKFEKWCNILDIEYTIYFKDKPGCLNPMEIEGCSDDLY